MPAPLLVILVVLILGVAWSQSDEPRAPLISGGSSSEEQGGSGSKGTSGSTKTPTKNPSLSDIEKDLDKAEKDALAIEKAIAQEKIKREQSEYASMFSFSSGSAGSSNPDTEYVTFTYRPKDDRKTLVSGFELRSTVTGRSAVIGKGVQLPFSGQVNSEESIFLSPGDKVIVITGRSPIGYSFRLNQCTGYFTQFQKFTPSLPKSCPEAEDEFDLFPTAPNNFSDACLDYLGTIPRCTMPLKNIPVAYLESQCYEFITQKINYKTCVEEHKNDRGFYVKEWRVYLGQSQELWKSRRETIKLLDHNKKTIGTVSY